MAKLQGIEKAEDSFNRTETSSDECQYVSFILADEEYGVPILKVQEIIRYTKLTRVPQSSEFVEGVLNLRGRVIPVIDLRKRFNLEPGQKDRHTRIVVVEVDNQTVGMIVDGVSEVLQISQNEIEPTPPLGARVNSEFIQGMGKVGERLMILLDINRILSTGEKSALEEIGNS